MRYPRSRVVDLVRDVISRSVASSIQVDCFMLAYDRPLEVGTVFHQLICDIVNAERTKLTHDTAKSVQPDPTIKAKMPL